MYILYINNKWQTPSMTQFFLENRTTDRTTLKFGPPRIRTHFHSPLPPFPSRPISAKTLNSKQSHGREDAPPLKSIDPHKFPIRRNPRKSVNNVFVAGESMARWAMNRRRHSAEGPWRGTGTSRPSSTPEVGTARPASWWRMRESPTDRSPTRTPSAASRSPSSPRLPRLPRDSRPGSSPAPSLFAPNRHGK